MANVKRITPVKSNKNEKAAKARLTEIQKFHNDLETTCVRVERDWLKLGRMVAAAIKKADHKTLGMTVGEWGSKCFGASRAKVFRLLRPAKALASLPEATLEKMPIGKANELARLPEKLRSGRTKVSKALIAKAVDASVDEKQFHAEVSSHIQKAGSVDARFEPVGFITAQGWRGMKLPQSVAEMWDEHVIQKVAHVRGIDINEKPMRRIEVYEFLMNFFRETEEKLLRDTFRDFMQETESHAETPAEDDFEPEAEAVPPIYEDSVQK